MPVSQITIIVDNQPGKLSELSQLMGAESLNIRAISVTQNGEKSVVQIIVEDPDRASNALASKGYEYKIDKVLAIEAPDHPGGLDAVFKPLKEQQINVQSMYSAIGRHGHNAILIIQTSEMEKAAELLRANYIHLLGEEVYNL